MGFKNLFGRKKETSTEQDPSLRIVPDQEVGVPFALTEDTDENVANFREAVAEFDEGSPREMTFGEKIVAMGKDQERAALLGHPLVGSTQVEVIEIHGFDGEDPRVVDHRIEDWLHDPSDNTVVDMFKRGQ